MRIWHISDTHTNHRMLKVPTGIDMVIFSGDCSNPRDPYKNESEVRDFIDWYSKLNIKYKLFVAGNHDTSIERRLVLRGDFTNRGITYLENESVMIDGLKITGSPYSPTFGQGWAFNKSRQKLHTIWTSLFDEDVDIIITHGPPRGILDLAYTPMHNLEQCGDTALLKRVMKVHPSLVCFGHIHDNDDIINQGTLKLSNLDTIFSNGSVVKDNQYGVLSSNGNVIEL